MSVRIPRASRWMRAARLLVVAGLPLLLGSCFLRLVLATVEVATIGDEIDLTLAIRSENVTAGVCRDRPFEGRGVECSYGIVTEDGNIESASSFELFTDFGLFGVLVDPLIVQVPESTRVDHARVDDGSVVLDLVVTETARFEAEPGVALSAEPGQKFLIFEFPTSISSTLPELDLVSGPQFDFDVQLNWQQATAPVGFIPLKVMFAGRVEAGGQVFYPPIFPCVTDIADVPAFNLVLGGPNNIIFDLLNHYFENRDLVCNDKVFDYSDAGGALLCDADGDDDVDREDIAAIVALRNTPAAGPADPLDRDGNGTINVLDARQCALECTNPDCAVSAPAPASGFACGLGFEAALPLLGWAALRRGRRARQASRVMG